MRENHILTDLERLKLKDPNEFKQLKRETVTRERQRIRDKISGSFEELTELLGLMSEHDKNLVFTESNLAEFFKALFETDTTKPFCAPLLEIDPVAPLKERQRIEKSNEHINKLNKKERDRLQKRQDETRERQRGLAESLINILGDAGEKLEPELCHMVKSLNYPNKPTRGIVALWLGRSQNLREFANAKSKSSR